jgi:hypothetical protein
MAVVIATSTTTTTADVAAGTGTISGSAAATGVSYFGSGATIAVSIAFGKGVYDSVADIDWIDVTASVRKQSPITITRGRSSERDTFQTGTLSLTLNNQDRNYDPEYSSGTYFGNLLPGRHIKVELTYSATTYVLFRGFIQGWPQDWEKSDNDAVVPIVAHDAFKYLARAVLPESRYYLEVIEDDLFSGWAWWRLGDPSGSTGALDSSGNNYTALYYVNPDGVINSTPADGLVTFAGGGARQVTSSAYPLAGPTSIYCTSFGFSVEAWITIPATIAIGVTHWIYYQPGNSIDKGINFYVTHTGGGVKQLAVEVKETTGSSRTITYTLPASAFGARHHVAFTRDLATVTLYFDGASVSTSATGTLGTFATSFGFPGYIGGFGDAVEGIVIDEFALYLGDLSAARVLAHYEAGSTVNAGEDVDARITTVLTDANISWLSTSLEDSQTTVRGADYTGTNNVLTYLQSLERTEQGRLFINGSGVLTFQNRFHDQVASTEAAFTDAVGSTLPYVDVEYEYDDTRVVNDATVSRTNGTPQRYTDTTSRSTYGLMSLSLDGLQGQSDEETKSMAQYLVTRYKDPYPRVRSLTVKPRSNPSGLFPKVGSLEIGDKVTFRRAPLGGTSFTKTLMVEGITHRIGADGTWETTYLTSAVDPSNYLILDDATFGQLDEEKVGY